MYYYPIDVIVLHPAYDPFAISGKKMGPKGAQPTTLDFVSKCAKKHISSWRLGFGMEHKEERMMALKTLEKLHESHPELLTVKLMVASWGEMTYRYIAEVKEGR